MYPELLHVGPLTVYSFGIMAATGLIVAVYVMWRVLSRYGLPFEAFYEILFAAGIGGFAGARIYYLAQHWSDVRGDLAGNLFGGAGFTWYGGLLGGFVLVSAWTLWRRIPYGLAANAAAPGIAIGYAIGRIGCQLAGDGDYGRPSDLPWAMGYPDGVVPTLPGVTVHPTPVYETLVMGAVFVLLYWMVTRRTWPGWYVFGWFLVLQGIERFWIEFLRLNPDFALGLTGPQWIGIASVIGGAAIVLVTQHRPPIETIPRFADTTGKSSKNASSD